MTPDLLFATRGNNLADHWANRGREMAAAPPDRDLAHHSHLVATAQDVIRVALATLTAWPRLPRGVPRVPVMPRVARDSVPHAWKRRADGWWCATCWKTARSLQRPALGTCKGRPRFLAPLTQGQRGHRIVIGSAEKPVALCWRCGAWGSNRIVNLARPCPRCPSAAGNIVLKRAAKGLHPTRDEAVDYHIEGVSDERAPGAHLHQPTGGGSDRRLLAEKGYGQGGGCRNNAPVCPRPI